MKTGWLAASVLFGLLVVTGADAQQEQGADHRHEAESPAGPGRAGTTGPMPLTDGRMGMMDMCRQMMSGGEMGMPMMGGMGMMMSGGSPADPKERAALLEMRGEMMKAMGDIMMKHARRLQESPGK